MHCSDILFLLQLIYTGFASFAPATALHAGEDTLNNVLLREHPFNLKMTGGGGWGVLCFFSIFKIYFFRQKFFKA